jgi:hypothetical protein
LNTDLRGIVEDFAYFEYNCTEKYHWYMCYRQHGANGNLIYYNKNVKLSMHFGKTKGHKTYIYTKTGTSMFTLTLLIITKTPAIQCPSTG